MTKQVTLSGDPDHLPYKDADTLRELYHGRGFTLREIGTRLCCDHTTVYYYMVEYDIERR